MWVAEGSRFKVQLVAPDAETLPICLKIVLSANTKLEGPRFDLIGDQSREPQILKEVVN